MCLKVGNNNRATGNDRPAAATPTDKCTSSAQTQNPHYLPVQPDNIPCCVCSRGRQSCTRSACFHHNQHDFHDFHVRQTIAHTELVCVCVCSRALSTHDCGERTNMEHNIKSISPEVLVYMCICSWDADTSNEKVTTCLLVMFTLALFVRMKSAALPGRL